MLFAAVTPMALAEDADVNETKTEANISDVNETIPNEEEPAIEPAEEFIADPTAEPAEEPAEEKPLTIGESALFMLKGMVGIFLVTGLMILVLVIMDKAGNRKKETQE